LTPNLFQLETPQTPNKQAFEVGQFWEGAQWGGKVTKAFNKVREISQFEGSGHNLSNISYSDLSKNLALKTYHYQKN
jgi:hypothetical protein